MKSEDAEELVRSVLAIARGGTATIDLIGVICWNLAAAMPDLAAKIRADLKQLLEEAPGTPTEEFVGLAARLDQALARDHNLAFRSLVKTPPPASPEQLRAQLRLIQGGKL